MSVDKFWLEGRVEGGAAVEFLHVERAAESTTPFALLRYSINGHQQKLGLRLDLDKGVILDRLNDPEKDAVLLKAAPQIFRLVRHWLDDRRTTSDIHELSERMSLPSTTVP